jgi:hypothetical protein
VNLGKVKEFKNGIFKAHTELEKRVKEIDDLKNKKSKCLKDMSNEMKGNYVSLTEGFREMVEMGDGSKVIFMFAERNNIGDKYSEFRRTGSEYVKQSEELFLELYRMSKSHEQMVRS